MSGQPLLPDALAKARRADAATFASWNLLPCCVPQPSLPSSRQAAADAALAVDARDRAATLNLAP